MYCPDGHDWGEWHPILRLAGVDVEGLFVWRICPDCGEWQMAPAGDERM